MAVKFFILLAAFGVASAAVVAPVANVAITAKLEDSEFDPNPQYTFAYNVQDAITGDTKSQIESRSGGLVQGQYSLIEPDGTKRIVDYTADPINGFNAIVSRAPLVAAAPAAPVVEAARVVAPAPVRVVAPAPVVESARFVAPRFVAPAHVDAPAHPIVAQRFLAPAPARLVAGPAHLTAAPVFGRTLASPYFAPLTYAV